MTKPFLAIATLLVAVGATSLAHAGGVYIQQLQSNGGGGAPALGDQGPAGGAFVTQLPPGAKLRPPPSVAAPAAVKYATASFIEQAAIAPVDSASEALISYAPGKRPGLPILIEGVNAAFNTPLSDAAIPSVEGGLLN